MESGIGGKTILLKSDVLGRVRMPKQKRESLLDEFERSGMSGAAFAKWAGISTGSTLNTQCFSAYHPITSTPALGAGRLAQIDGPLDNDLIAYVYDDLGRISARAINSVGEAYTYDVLSRLSSMSNPLGTTTYTYVNHTGRLASIALPNGVTSALSYYNNTGDQRLQQIRHETSGSSLLSQFAYQYSATGNIQQWTQSLGTASPQEWNMEQDAVDQLTGIRVKESSTLVKEYAYGYDKAGNRLTEQVDNQVTSSNHNNLNQLTSQTAGGWMKFSGTLSEPARVTVGGNPASVDGSNQFTGLAQVNPGNNTVAVVATDGSGNVKTNNYSVSVSGSSRSVAYDLNGNMTSNGTGQTYTWDAENRLSSITYTGGASTEFAYDGYSRRTRIHEKNAGGATTSDRRYLWCGGNQPCEERDASGSTVLKHFYMQGVYVPAASAPANKLFYTKDHLGSIRELTDDNQNVVARYSYDPWGRRTKVSGLEDADFGYTGHFEHSTSGLTLTWYRAYDAELARWLSRDPMENITGEMPELEEGPNLYAYVDNDPLNYIDPLGLSKGGKQKISVNHQGQTLTKSSPQSEVQKALQTAEKTNMSPKHIGKLKGLLKVIKRGGTLGVLLDIQDMLDNDPLLNPYNRYIQVPIYDQCGNIIGYKLIEYKIPDA
jgi:RHS repeat-associated protein